MLYIVFPIVVVWFIINLPAQMKRVEKQRACHDSCLGYAVINEDPCECSKKYKYGKTGPGLNK